MWEELRSRGIKVGVLSNTIWPREWHVGFFERDGVYDLVDGDVYSSEIPWTKPSPRAFGAAMEAVGVSDPGRVRLRGGPALRRRLGRPQRRPAGHPRPAEHASRPAQVGHTEGEPDASVTSLAQIPEVVRSWDDAATRG